MHHGYVRPQINVIQRRTKHCSYSFSSPRRDSRESVVWHLCQVGKLLTGVTSHTDGNLVSFSRSAQRREHLGEESARTLCPEHEHKSSSLLTRESSMNAIMHAVCVYLGLVRLCACAFNLPLSLQTHCHCDQHPTRNVQASTYQNPIHASPCRERHRQYTRQIAPCRRHRRG